MFNRAVRFLTHRFAFFLLAGFAFAFLHCCGAATKEEADDGLAISLEIPAGVDPSIFWLGVQKKTLRVGGEEEGEAREYAWESGSRWRQDLRAGEKIEFLGSDEAGRLVVAGDAVVTEEKKITIPLRRVL